MSCNLSVISWRIIHAYLICYFPVRARLKLLTPVSSLPGSYTEKVQILNSMTLVFIICSSFLCRSHRFTLVLHKDMICISLCNFDCQSSLNTYCDTMHSCCLLKSICPCNRQFIFRSSIFNVFFFTELNFEFRESSPVKDTSSHLSYIPYSILLGKQLLHYCLCSLPLAVIWKKFSVFCKILKTEKGCNTDPFLTHSYWTE